MSFYKKENDFLIEAPNFVKSPTFELTKENKDNHTYPIDGWVWFDTREEALQHFDLTEEDII